jgi:mannosyltransferase
MMISTATAANQKNGPIGSRAKQHLRSLLPLLAVYLLLALYGIDRQSLWQDEFHSIERVTSSIPFWEDGHGFLYYAFLAAWVQLGTSEFIVRSLSVLFGAVAVCLIYALGHILLNRRSAVIATALLATSPYFIWYSQEARYITLTILGTLLTTYAFCRLILGPRFGWWVTYAITVLLTFFSFLSTLILPVVHGMHLVGYRSRRCILKRWLVCQLVVFALFGWWFVNGTHFWQVWMAKQTSQQENVGVNPKLLPFSGDWNNVRPAVIPYTFFAFSAGFSFGPPPRDLYADRTFAPLLRYAPSLIVLTVLYSGLLVSGFFSLDGQRESRMLLILWMAVPVLGVFALAKLLDLFYDVRYVAMALPAYLFLLSAGIARFRRIWVQLALVSAVLAVHGTALANYYFEPKYAREDTRSAARFLESAAGSQDVALVVGTVSSLPHYYRGTLSIVDFRTLGEANESVTERLEKVTANYDRLWLVQIRPWQVDRTGRVKAALDNSYELIERHHFPGVDVLGYEIP